MIVMNLIAQKVLNFKEKMNKIRSILTLMMPEAVSFFKITFFIR